MNFPQIRLGQGTTDLSVRWIPEEDAPSWLRGGKTPLLSDGKEIRIFTPFTPEGIREKTRALSGILPENPVTIQVILPEGLESVALEALLDALYRFTLPPGESHTLLLDRDFPDRLRVEHVMRGVWTARTLGTIPANLLSPVQFVKRVQGLFQDLPVEIRVLDENDLQEKGFGGILAVARGSHQPPRLLRLSYAPGSASSSLNLVGKGVVFDTGGVNLKIVRMNELVSMRQDKAGAATVVGIVEAVARTGMPVRVEAAVPLVENMPGGNATRPGDVVRMYSGKHVEITNTDAEGRLILADALAFIQEEQPGVPTLDFATLTGAAVVALGKSRAPVFSNREELRQALLRAGEETSERLWPLPVGEEYGALLKSRVAELMNSSGKREAGAIVGATFLWHFVDETTPWAHVDIAGTGIGDPWATGFGVRLVERFLRSGISPS